MQTFTTWAPPVAVSLLLHAALIALVAYQMSLPQTGKVHESSITLTLQEQAPANENKPHLKAVKPILKTSTPQPTSTIPAPVEPQTPVATTEPTPAASQDNNAAVEPVQTGLTIHPLNSLTRPPAFRHRIEPVYPVSERRAGSQAYVLAEVTIDEQGNVHEARIVKSAGTNFDNAVLNALKKSVFVPGYIDNKPAATRVFVPFRFNLK